MIEEIEKFGVEKIWRKINQEKVLYAIIIVLIGLLMIETFFPNAISSLKLTGGGKKYNIEVIKIQGCEDCFDLSLVTSLLSKIENVKIEEKSLDYNSDGAKKLINKYEISKIPALIVLGKVDKLNLDENMFRIVGNAAIFDKPAPYIDLKTNEKKGLVNILEVYDSKCLDCTSLSNIKTSLENAGIKVNNYEKVEAISDKGKSLIQENNLTFLPSLLISKNIEEYWWIFPNLQNLFYDKDYYVLKNPLAPYKDIKTGKIKGKVAITYITNKSCEDCYNVTLLKDLFGSVGIYISNERYVDVSSGEGKNLIVNYNITAIPTAVLSKEVLDYNIKSTLERVGKFVNDEFILTNLDSLNLKYQRI